MRSQICPGIGHYQQGGKEDGEQNPQQRIDLKQHSGVFLPAHLHKGGSGGKTVADGGAGGGHIHHPADDRSAKPGGQQGDDHNKDQRQVGRMIAGVQLAEPRGQHLFLGHGIKQSAGRHIKADDAAEHRAQQRHPQQNQSRNPQYQLGGVKGGQGAQSLQALGQHIQLAVGNVGQPALIAFRQGGRGQGIQDDVQRRADQDGQDHDDLGLTGRKVEFLRGLRDGIKAHKGPGGDGNHGQDTAQLQGAVPLAQKARLQMGRGSAAAEQRGHSQQQDRPYQSQRQPGLELAGDRDAADTQHRKEHQRYHRQQQFTGIDAVALHRIKVAPLGQPGKQVPADEGQGRRIQRNDGQIAEPQKPRADKARRRPEGGVGKGEFPAGDRETVDHVIVVKGDADHDKRRKAHGDRRSPRPRVGQKGVSGHHKGTPANDAAQRQRPDIQRRKPSLQLVFGFFRFHNDLLFLSVSSLHTSGGVRRRRWGKVILSLCGKRDSYPFFWAGNSRRTSSSARSSREKSQAVGSSPSRRSSSRIRPGFRTRTGPIAQVAKKLR